MERKIKVAVLGATGAVGQRFVELLQDHPWFYLHELAASKESAGRSYEEAVRGRWIVSGDVPETAKSMTVRECRPDLESRLVFSALDSSIAGPIEEEIAKAGYIVSSNSRNHRMDPDVPLLIPEVNPEHLRVIERQKRNRRSHGYIITNPNCSTIGLAICLKPLYGRFGLRSVFVVTYQALSGAGYPGVPALAISDNVIPYIKDEEPKIEAESLKLLGKYENGRFEYADIRISAQCARVNVTDGHLEAVSVELGRKADLDEVVDALKTFKGLPQEYKLPSAPECPIIVREEEDRPQPKFDRMEGNGMPVVIGRIRKCNVLDYKFFLLSHNTMRGAAGTAVLNAELLNHEGYL